MITILFLVLIGLASTFQSSVILTTSPGCRACVVAKNKFIKRESLIREYSKVKDTEIRTFSKMRDGGNIAAVPHLCIENGDLGFYKEWVGPKCVDYLLLYLENDSKNRDI